MDGEVVCLTPMGLARLTLDEGDWTAKITEEGKAVRFGESHEATSADQVVVSGFVVYSDSPTGNKSGDRRVAIDWPLKAE